MLEPWEHMKTPAGEYVMDFKLKTYVRWCPRSESLTWFTSPITMVCGTYNYSIHGDYKPTNITRGYHLVEPVQR